MSDFVAYYRVSTAKQGQSGLGLEAQRESVGRFLSSRQAGSDQPIAEFTEIESGKRSKNRPQLLAAIELCKAKKAVLVVAKLDRLARNVHFISGLDKSKIAFVAVDMPDANELTVHIMAAMAQHEAKMIGQRTKAALAQSKKKLGNPRWSESIEIARKARVALSPTAEQLSLMRQYRADGMAFNAIADRLNALGIKTPKGNAWHPMTVSRVLAA
jgi:DNA invertase Pin-like site-specific DNA recombinase